MKKLATALLAFTLIGSSACGNNDDVVATYQGGQVTAEQIMQHFNSVLAKQEETKGKKFREFDDKTQESLIRNYVTLKMLRKEADDLGITKKASFKEKLQMSENHLIQQELFEAKIKDMITEKTIDDEYNKLKDALQGQKEYKVSHILVDSESKAKDIKSQIFKGVSFDKLAQKHSTDEATKPRGGSLGYITKGTLVPEFEAKAFSMKKDEVSGPVQTNFGWHIIKVHDIRDVQIPAKKDITNELRNKVANDIIMKYLKEIEEKAKIEFKANKS